MIYKIINKFSFVGQINMSNCCLSWFDQTSSTQIFKIGKESSYKTCPGVILTFIYVGIVAFLISQRVINRQNGELMNIITREDYNYLPIQVNGTSDIKFMFAVAVSKSTLNYDSKYFYFILTKNLEHYQDENALQLCTPAHWDLIPHKPTNFDKLRDRHIWYCPQLQFSISMVESGEEIQLSEIIIKSKENRLQQLNTTRDQLFTLHFIYSSSFINANQQDYMTQCLNYRKLLQFDLYSSNTVPLFYSLYNIFTDRSWLGSLKPQPSKKSVIFLEEIGNIVSQKSPSGSFIYIDLLNSKKGVIISRTDQDLVDILIYIGGLIGFFLIFFQFIASKYSSIKFAIDVGRNIQKAQRQANGQEEQPEQKCCSQNVCTQIGESLSSCCYISLCSKFCYCLYSCLQSCFYCCFSLCNSLFCCCSKWRQKMQKTMDVMNDKLDVQNIIKSLIKLEKQVQRVDKQLKYNVQKVDQQIRVHLNDHQQIQNEEVNHEQLIRIDQNQQPEIANQHQSSDSQIQLLNNNLDADD